MLRRVPLLVLLAACSRGGVGPDPALDLAAAEADLVAAEADSGGGGDDQGGGRDLRAGGDLRSGPDLASPPDLWSGVLDVRITVSGGCRVTTDPPSYGVTKGGTFTVNWINQAASDAPVDIAKIDMFNQVPIVIGLGAGMSYHDKVRSWCGLFTGTFSFRIEVGPGCSYMMPIRCDL